jgi:urea transport system ATP-binding protein
MKAEASELDGGLPADDVIAPAKIDASHGVILYVEGVTVSFDGFRALNDLSFAVDKGEVRCVIGPTAQARRP